jgi:hypothetical protein
MSKTKNKSKSPTSGPKTYSKPTNHIEKTTSSSHKTNSKSALDEIDTLFASKKQSTKLAKQELQQQAQAEKLERQKRKEARLEEEADELTLRGCSSTTAAAKRMGDAAAPQSLHSKALQLKSLTYTRSDLAQLNNNSNGFEEKQKWASDGLGGIFNGEGYTGRKDEGGHRVFKAHLMNKEGFGMSKDCPFDCDCCFI